MLGRIATGSNQPKSPSVGYIILWLVCTCLFFSFYLNTLKCGCHNFYLFHLHYLPITSRQKGVTQLAWVARILHNPKKILKACLQDWPLAGSWETVSEPLEYAASEEWLCVPEALGQAAPVGPDKYIPTL